MVLVAQRVRAVRRGTDVARCVVGIGGRDRRAGRVGVAAVGVARFRFELILVVVGVAHLRPANRAAGGGFGFLNLRNVAERVVDVAVARNQRAARHAVVVILDPRGGFTAVRIVRLTDGIVFYTAIAGDRGFLQPLELVVGQVDFLAGGCAELFEATVAGSTVVIGIILRIDAAVGAPLLFRQAVIAVVGMLRAQLERYYCFLIGREVPERPLTGNFPPSAKFYADCAVLWGVLLFVGSRF